jgi:hypothetical protein
MTTTPTILTLHHRGKPRLNKLQNKTQPKATIFAKVSFPSQKFNPARIRPKIIFGKFLKKNFPGAILPSTKQNEKSIGLASMLMEMDIFLLLKSIRECAM